MYNLGNVKWGIFNETTVSLKSDQYFPNIFYMRKRAPEGGTHVKSPGKITALKQLLCGEKVQSQERLGLWSSVSLKCHFPLPT